MPDKPGKAPSVSSWPLGAAFLEEILLAAGRDAGVGGKAVCAKSVVMIITDFSYRTEP
jgi:hypothetical protein